MLKTTVAFINSLIFSSLSSVFSKLKSFHSNENHNNCSILINCIYIFFFILWNFVNLNLIFHLKMTNYIFYWKSFGIFNIMIMCSFYYILRGNDDLHWQKVQKSGVHIMCARPVCITVFHHDKSPLYEPYVWY